MRALLVYSNKDLVGALLEENNIWRFAYDKAWIGNRGGFSLAPSIPRVAAETLDGSTTRPVQWFFDNLLPEERLREVVAQEAGVKSPEDSFSLLEYLGKESAGSLTLVPPGVPLEVGHELKPLTHQELSGRIQGLPKSSLVNHQVKRMSLAGAQHKMLAVIKQDKQTKFYEPVGATASTHILKPDHPDKDRFPASVMNEYVTMSLAHAAKLNVPTVGYDFVPEPVYWIERFDRSYQKLAMVLAPELQSADVERLHVLDACQLLSLPSTFKYSSASLDTLNKLIGLSSNKAATRLALFRWLVFNMVVGNNDNHLKNLSFLVNGDSISLAPHYDLLSTLAYETKAITGDIGSDWASSQLVFALPNAQRFSEVTRDKAVEGGRELGLTRSIALRVVNETVGYVQKVSPILLREDAPHLAGDAQRQRLARVMSHIVISEMLKKLGS